MKLLSTLDITGISMEEVGLMMIEMTRPSMTVSTDHIFSDAVRCVLPSFLCGFISAHVGLTLTHFASFRVTWRSLWLTPGVFAAAPRFDQFQQWWHLKKHGRPKMPKCPEEFIMAMASVMADHLRPYGKNEQVVGKHALIHTDEGSDTSFFRYGERLCLVMGGTVVIVKNPPRDNDVVIAVDRFAEAGGEMAEMADIDVPAPSKSFEFQTWGTVLSRKPTHSEPALWYWVSLDSHLRVLRL